MTGKFFDKTVLIVAGPTAVGKTAVAIELARFFQTQIISADSRQCYRELNIGVARPSVAELEAVPHHFIASHSIYQESTAAVFEQFALQKLETLFREHDLVIMTGGTGLYLKAFTEGLDPVPAIDPAIRREIAEIYQSGGLSALQERIREEDPGFFREAEIQNPQRIQRALEVIRGTGKPLAEFQKGIKTKRPFNIIKTALELPRELLNSRINQRVELMMSAGLVEEARALYPQRAMGPLRTVGYSELFDHFDGRLSLEEAKSLIALHTRQYAKRQMTWFKKDQEYLWFPPSAIKELRELPDKFIRH